MTVNVYIINKGGEKQQIDTPAHIMTLKHEGTDFQTTVCTSCAAVL